MGQLSVTTHVNKVADGDKILEPIRGIEVSMQLRPGAVPVFNRTREPPLPSQADVNKELDVKWNYITSRKW